MNTTPPEGIECLKESTLTRAYTTYEVDQLALIHREIYIRQDKDILAIHASAALTKVDRHIPKLNNSSITHINIIYNQRKSKKYFCVSKIFTIFALASELPQVPR